MFEYLHYLSYIMTISNGVIYQPFIDYLTLYNSKYQLISDQYTIKDSLNMYQCVSIILLFFSFWGEWLAICGMMMMLPCHMIGTWVSFHQICDRQDEHDKCIRDPVDVMYFNISFLLSTINLYFVSSYFYSLF